VVELASFDPNRVDMLTIVIIGSRSSRAFRRGDGQLVAFTPRGYAGKPRFEIPAPAPAATALASPTPGRSPAEAAPPPTSSGPLEEGAEVAQRSPAAVEAATMPPSIVMPRNPIQAGVAFLRNRARSTQLPSEPAEPRKGE
jgi:hypothetical protein